MPCEVERSTKSSSDVTDHVPQCKKTGHYEEVQCSAWTGYCWCVDTNGTEMAGSRTREHLSCPSLAVSSLTVCQQQVRYSIQSPLGGNAPRCKEDGRFEEIQCDHVTGFCWCVDDSGTIKEGTKTNGTIACGNATPLSRCHQARQSIFIAIEHAQSAPLFIPTCRDDGSFAEVQCHGLTGQCWCVDMNGIEIPGSVTRGHRPDCKKAGMQ
ncbi:predicted protein [Nematostella vectensis]|uniref:Thyroglobulin type-1 domain-containing protein n=1 Tax=Nematostella vectensis TaxID=45351 RepID=A7RL42_NEMVE|nr:predicted protein [Nematostella vectensis]|eukprot:XP_001639859.1 predicted protein [Nematostella vectensis]